MQDIDHLKVYDTPPEGGGWDPFAEVPNPGRKSIYEPLPEEELERVRKGWEKYGGRYPDIPPTSKRPIADIKLEKQQQEAYERAQALLKYKNRKKIQQQGLDLD
jgi:hypothetical protein